MRYVYLTKAKRSIFIRDKLVLSSDVMLYKDYGSKGSVAKKSLAVFLEGLGAKTN
jgi:hypothetical protein